MLSRTGGGGRPLPRDRGRIGSRLKPKTKEGSTYYLDSSTSLHIFDLENIVSFSSLTVKKDKLLQLSVAKQRIVNLTFLKGLDCTSMRGYLATTHRFG
jgi:hypothetical protein